MQAWSSRLVETLKTRCSCVCTERTPPCMRCGNGSHLQAMHNHTFHKLFAEHVEAAGEAGVLLLRVAGTDAVLTTSPAAFAAVLRKTGFIPKPLSLYGGILMFVRPPPPSPLFPPETTHTGPTLPAHGDGRHAW